MGGLFFVRAFCFLLSAFSLLPSAFSLLPSAFSFLLSPFCFLPSAFALSRLRAFALSRSPFFLCQSAKICGHLETVRRVRPQDRKRLLLSPFCLLLSLLPSPFSLRAIEDRKSLRALLSLLSFTIHFGVIILYQMLLGRCRFLRSY